jgi:hypothetical protein
MGRERRVQLRAGTWRKVIFTNDLNYSFLFCSPTLTEQPTNLDIKKTYWFTVKAAAVAHRWRMTEPKPPKYNDTTNDAMLPPSEHPLAVSDAHIPLNI